jgi:hypothetical protein
LTEPDDTSTIDGQISWFASKMLHLRQLEFQGLRHGRWGEESSARRERLTDAAHQPRTGNRGGQCALSSNGLSGNMKVTYNGSLGGYAP